MTNSPSLIAFNGGPTDCMEATANVFLAPLRLALGYSVEVIGDQVDKNSHMAQLSNVIAKIALLALQLLVAPFTLLGLLFNHLSTTHYQKYQQLIALPLPSPDETPSRPTSPRINPSCPIDVSPLNLDASPDCVYPRIENLSEAVEGFHFPHRTFTPMAAVPSATLKELDEKKPTPGLGALDHVALAAQEFARGAVHVATAVGRVAVFAKDVVADKDEPWKQQKHYLVLQRYEYLYISEYARLQRSPDDVLAKETVKLLLLVQNLDEKAPSSMRNLHRTFLAELRKVLESNEYKTELQNKKEGRPYSPAVDSLLEICYTRFKKSEICEFTFHVIVDAICRGRAALDRPIAPDEVIKLTLTEQFEAIDHAPEVAPKLPRWRDNLEGATDVAFDPHGKGANVPHALYSIPGAVIGSSRPTVSAIRFGTPTSSGVIIPEFRCFLEALRFRKEKHVYFNMQEYGKEKGSAREVAHAIPGVGRALEKAYHIRFADDARSRAIIALEKEFRGVLNVVTLAQDSEFYKQSGAKWGADAKIDGQQFQDAFMKELLETSGKSGFYFPQAWVQDERFTAHLKFLQDQVYDILFVSKAAQPTLSLQERKDFIELYYAFLELYIIEYAEADSFNIACKDAIDRAGKANALLFELILVMIDKTNSVRHQEDLLAITHGPAYLTKKQAMLKHRRERLESALKYLRDPSVKWRVGEFCEQLQIARGVLDVDVRRISTGQAELWRKGEPAE